MLKFGSTRCPPQVSARNTQYKGENELTLIGARVQEITGATMPNIHGLHSIRSNDPPSRRSTTRRGDNDDDSDDDDEDDEDSNRRYVGGIDARGGGSGLAVLPNPNEYRSSSGGGRAADAIFGMAESAASLPSSSNSSGSGGESTSRRTITMYRSGFTVDNGPYRRLDDVNNTEFLTSLARGRIPRELQLQAAAQRGDDNDDEDDNIPPEVMVGLVDRRSEEYDPNKHGSSGNNAGGGPTPSFTGEGNSLGSGSSSDIASTSGGIIDPSSSDMSSTTVPLPVDETRPVTTIAVRLLDGKRLVVKVNTDVAVIEVARHIGSNSGNDRYVMTSGYPPSVIEDLTQSVESAGLKGAQVVLKKA
jgi:UBX domain-containing protein 1